MLSVFAILLFFIGLGIVNLSNIKKNLAKLIKKDPNKPQQTDNSGAIAEIKEAVSKDIEKPPYSSRKHTEGYMKLRKVLDVFPSVDYIPTVFRVYRDIRKANEYKPVEGFGRLGSAIYTYLFESNARAFHLDSSEKYARLLAAAKFGVVGDAIDDIVDTKYGKDVSDFLNNIEEIRNKGETSIPEDSSEIEAACYRLTKSLFEDLTSLNKRILSQKELADLVYSDYHKDPERISLEDVRTIQGKTGGEYWTHITDIMASYDLNKAERDAIRTIGTGVQVLDDITDYKQDKEEGGSANTVIVLENMNGGKYHKAVAQAYELSKKYLDEGFNALKSESVRPEVAEAMDTIHRKFKGLYAIEKTRRGLSSIYKNAQS